MAVRKLSTLVPVEQICSMNGVVSGSRRVDLWHIRSSKTLYYFGHAEKIVTKMVGTNGELQKQQRQTTNQDTRVVLVMSWNVDVSV